VDEADEIARLAELQEEGERFFDGRAFVPSALSQFLRDRAPVAAGGELLHVYRDGAYRPDGEPELREQIAEALGPRWRKRHADETVAHLFAVAPRLAEHPPLGRINCRNGIFDLATGELAPHDPALLTPVQIPVDFDPEAECPEIARFLGEVLPGLERLAQELIAYLLLPDNSLQGAFMFIGPGANGKSSLMALIEALLGAENVANVPLHRLEDDRFATAELYGKLANVFADLDARALSSTSMFKSITGGDSISAARKFRDSFSFKPYARLIYSANEPPPTPDGSDAFFRRWVVLPFSERFEGREDRRLLERLTRPEELSGLRNLTLLLRPALIRRGRFLATEETRVAADEFRVATDSSSAFAAECVVLAEDRRIGLPKLYRTYTTWCSEGGLQPFSARRFNRRLRDHFRGRWTCGRSPGRAPGSASSSARTRRYLGGDRADVAGVPGPAETDEGDRDGHATRTGARPPYR